MWPQCWQLNSLVLARLLFFEPCHYSDSILLCVPTQDESFVFADIWILMWNIWMWILTILLLKAPVLCIYRPVRKLALKSEIDEMSFDVGWQLEESCGEKRDFILFIVTLKKYLDGQQMGVFTNAFWNMHLKLGQTLIFQDLIFLWSNLTVGPVCLEPIAIP